jgi:polyhydroxyalkanoate synthesis repressor PhaR
MTHCVILNDAMRQEPETPPDARPCRLIRRYENRKLYDTEAKGYVSLADLARLVREGHELRVEEHPGGEDITAQTLMRIIAEEERNGQTPLPNEFLHDVVRWGDRLVTTSRGHLERGWNRAVELLLDRVGPLQQARDEMGRLAARLEELEAEVRAMAARPAGPSPTEREQGDRET